MYSTNQMKDKDKEPPLFTVLGVTSARCEAIAKDVTSMVTSANTHQDALIDIANKYDPESVLAGMRFEFLLNVQEIINHTLN